MRNARFLPTVVAIWLALPGVRVAASPPDPPGPSSVDSMLATLHAQIQLHDLQHPNDPYDPALGWSQLVDRGYLPAPLRNPLARDRTDISAGRAPDRTAGWACAPDASGAPTTVTVRARDVRGVVLDTRKDLETAFRELSRDDTRQAPLHLAAVIVATFGVIAAALFLWVRLRPRA